jgi:hypothetical protein
MSDTLADFMRYAAAFEEALATDDWGRVDVLFDDDVVWAAGGPGLPPGAGYFARGRSDVSAAVKKSCDMYDRRFDRREPMPTSRPVAIPGGIHLEWMVRYARDGLPPMVVRGAEWDLFRDGKLVMHYECIHNGPEFATFLMEHDAALLPAR